MNRISLPITVAIAVVVQFAGMRSADAQSHTTYIAHPSGLSGAAGHCGSHGHFHHGGPSEYAAPVAVPQGYIAPRPKSPYAYGWFGVQRRCHPGFSKGFYRNRPQWKHR